MLSSALVVLGLTSCGTPGAPKGEICLVDAQRLACRCYDSLTERIYDRTIGECDKYVARSPDYDEKLALWCQEGWRKAGEKK